MNILSQTIENVTKNFSNILSNYDLDSIFDGLIITNFNHYINIIRCIDHVSNSFSIDLYKQFIKEIDDAFFHSSYRKQFCEVINSPNRSMVTFYGEVVFNRRYYYDKLKKRKFFFIDDVLRLPKFCRFDPFVCAKICEVSSRDSYAKAGRIVSEMIGKRLKFNDDPSRFLINRATARKIVINFKIPNIDYEIRSDVEKLYIMLDEKFVHSQFNNGNDWMIKAAVVFENVEAVYKYKKKTNSMDRFKLVGKHVLASVDNDLAKKVMDYIYYTYNTDNIKELVFMGDCAKWITTFPFNFQFNSDIKIIFAIDGYHYAQTLQHICTNKYINLIPIIKNYIKNNSKKGFISLCNNLVELEPHRIETITEKMNYILTNWNYIQNYYHEVSMKCCMESNISHCFADIFTSRPKAYSYNGIKQLLKLRLLRVNNQDINKIYFDVLNKKHENKEVAHFDMFEKLSKPDYYTVPIQINKILQFRLHS